MMITRKRRADLETEKTQNDITAKSNHSSRLDSSQSSQESCSSLTSLPFKADSWKDVKKKLESIAWIQCDKLDCKKWRKISTAMLKNVSESDKWFCHQNSDPNFSSCSIPEEDVQLYDQLAERSGLKYLKSQLSPGALVWAKMDGYCRWPSVITPEPGTDIGHLSRYDDGEIALYHVEFLGEPHSHGWVSSKNVTVFTPSSANKEGGSSHQTQHRGRKRNEGGRSRRPFCTPSAQKLKRVYKTGVCVEDGIDEAMIMLPLSPSKRLNRCIYTQKKQVLHLESDKKDKPSCNLTSEGSLEKITSKPNETKNSELVSLLAEKPDIPISQWTSFDSCLKNKTKEERLMLDVQMYMQNERAFIHDVTRFLIRNGLKPCKAPFWQNQSISIFQLFLAVHERGGYMQVTGKKKWAAVYREVTETPCQKDVSNSYGARLFYYRHLYPYELYVHGKDFTEVVSELKEDATCQSSEKNTADILQTKQLKKRKQNQKEKGRRNPVQNSCSIDDNVMEDEDIASDSLRQMLQALEENSKLDFEQVENDIDITFYDDSTPSHGKLLPLTDFEPEGANVPLVPAMKDDGNIEGLASCDSQQVLHHLENVIQACSQQKQQCSTTLQVVPSMNENRDDKNSASGFSQHVLEELDVLQDTLNFIDHQID